MLRCSAAPLLRGNPARPTADGQVPAKLFGLQSHHNDMMHPDTLAILGRIRALTDRYPGTTTLGEVSSQDGAFNRVRRYTAGEERLHMAYTLRPLRGGFDQATVNGLIEAAAADASTPGWPCWSFSNHDVERAASRWKPPGAQDGDPRFVRLLAMLLLSLRGSVCLYQGEELGLPEAELLLQDVRDPFGLTYWPEFRGRDGSRTPMPWAFAQPNAGFSEARPWLPVPEVHRALAVDRQEADPASLLQMWRRAIGLRRACPALMRGTQRQLDLPAPVVGLVREHGRQSILVLFNLSAEPARLRIPELGGATVLPDVAGLGAWIEVEEGEAVAMLPPFGTLMATVDPALVPVLVPARSLELQTG
ncbi:alpha-amylase family glycosyl hydrolase [Teichococcus vastitatis]